MLLLWRGAGRSGGRHPLALLLVLLLLLLLLLLLVLLVLMLRRRRLLMLWNGGSLRGRDHAWQHDRDRRSMRRPHATHRHRHRHRHRGSSRRTRRRTAHWRRGAASHTESL